MESTRISLEHYRQICSESNISPNYHPDFVEFYFTQLAEKPKIIGRFDDQGRLVAAYPVLLGQVFPNSLHKRFLGQRYKKLGDIGQPEALFPVIQSDETLRLYRLSPTTSPILREVVRGFWNYSLKSVAIAKKTKHARLARTRKSFLGKGGRVVFANELDKIDFSEIYIRLYAEKWGYSSDNLRYIREQIIRLYNHVHGNVLFKDNQPVAAILCFKAEGKSIYYVDAVNMGVKASDEASFSYGSIALLESLRKAEEDASFLGKTLRYSFGYYYGEKDYKNLWATPEKTFIAF